MTENILVWSKTDRIVGKFTSELKSSKGKPSTALMLSWEPGCTMANPPDTVRVSAFLATSQFFLLFSPWMRVFIHQSTFELPLAYLQKNCLLPPLSSIISTSPGFNCSMEGTWLAKTPISPDSAGMLICTLSMGLRSARAWVHATSEESRWRVTHTSVDLYIDYRND